MTAKSLEKPAPSKKLKKWMIFTGWVWQEISGIFSDKEKQLDRRSQKSLFEDTYYSAEKVKSELNYRFEPISEVIARTAAAFRKDKTI